jgi:Transposase, Mutator family
MRVWSHAPRRKEPLGLSLSSTENGAVCTELLQDLLARGLAVDGRVLCMIDGGKGVRKALGDVLGDAAVIQRCQLHKGRNLEALVPKARQVYVRAALRRAYRVASSAAARRGSQSTGGVGGNAHGADAGATAHAATLLRADELHRELDRHPAAREPQRQTLERRRHAAALAGPRPGARGRALPPDQESRRSRRACDRARHPRGPGAGGVSLTSGDAKEARAITGSESIFSRGSLCRYPPERGEQRV